MTGVLPRCNEKIGPAFDTCNVRQRRPERECALTVLLTPLCKLAPRLDRRHLMLIPDEGNPTRSGGHVPSAHILCDHDVGQQANQEW